MSQPVYVPAISIMRVTAKHALGKIFVASALAPDHVCGVARRIGYTGKAADALAIYRLKIKMEDNPNIVTLPQLFVVDKGSFIEYEEWLCDRGNLI